MDKAMDHPRCSDKRNGIFVIDTRRFKPLTDNTWEEIVQTKATMDNPMDQPTCSEKRNVSVITETRFKPHIGALEIFPEASIHYTVNQPTCSEKRKGSVMEETTRFKPGDNLAVDDTVNQTTSSDRRNGNVATEAKRSEPSTGNVVPETEAPDGGWGWVIVLSCFIVQLTNFGLTSAWGLLYPDLQSKYNTSLTTVSWLGSMYTGIAFLAAPLICQFLERFGCRVTGMVGVTLLFVGFLSSMFVNNIYLLYFTASILPGSGHGLQYFTSLNVLTMYFDKKRPLAMGLAATGGSLGVVFMSPLISFLITTYGIWGTWLLLGGLVLQQFSCVMTYRPLRKSATNDTSKGTARSEYCTLLRRPKILLVLTHEMLQSLVFLVLHSFIATIARHRVEGLTLNEISVLLLALGVASTCGRFLAGALSTTCNRFTLHMYIFFHWCVAVTTVFVEMADTYLMLIAICSVYGLFHGGIWALHPLISIQLFGPDAFSRVYGLVLFVGGVNILAGAPLAGFLAEVLGREDTLVYMTSTGFLVSGSLLVPLIPHCGSSRTYQVNKITQ